MQLFDRLQTEDSLLNRIQDRLKTVVNNIARKPIVDGQLITATLAAVPSNKVAHGLGRVARGWILTNGAGGSTIAEAAAPDAKFLTLSSTGVATVNLWVF